MGKRKLAIRAAVVAFRSVPNLAIYLRIQELGGERWSRIKPKLLSLLRRCDWTCAEAKVDVFVHEGLWDDAIKAVTRNVSYDLAERVMDSVVDHRPDWVIGAARERAEGIMDAGKAKYYHHAVGWLERMCKAYQVAGRGAEWQAYLREIRERHSRKYKLMGLLKGL
jgi:uncharacterized Zn finger protein